MDALVVRLTIHNADRTREVLTDQVVPQVSGEPGFKAGYRATSHWMASRSERSSHRRDRTVHTPVNHRGEESPD
jgi:hypothetical protein